LDPEHYPNDREIEKENNVRDPRVGERDRDNGGAAGNRPVGRDIEPRPPNHNPPHFTAMKMRHRVDVAGIVEASLERNGRLFVYGWSAVFRCHGSSINRITGAESNNSSCLSRGLIWSIQSKSR